MYHPLYHHARRLVGQPVYAHHRNGRVIYGTLLSTTPQGIYLAHQQNYGMMCAPLVDAQADFLYAINQEKVIDASLVYSPGGYFAFGALTGLTAAALFF